MSQTGFGPTKIHKSCTKYLWKLSLTCADDGCLGVASEAVLQDPGELAVSVRDVGGDAAAQLLDDLTGKREMKPRPFKMNARILYLTQRHQTLVNVASLLQSRPSGPGLGGSL